LTAEACQRPGRKPHLYNPRDQAHLYIKKLLRDERYTIEGAKQVLKNFSPEVDNGETAELMEPPKQRARSKMSAASGRAGGEAVPGGVA